jgi:hypothetical protein
MRPVPLPESGARASFARTRGGEGRGFGGGGDAAGGGADAVESKARAPFALNLSVIIPLVTTCTVSSRVLPINSGPLPEPGAGGSMVTSVLVAGAAGGGGGGGGEGGGEGGGGNPALSFRKIPTTAPAHPAAASMAVAALNIGVSDG